MDNVEMIPVKDILQWDSHEVNDLNLPRCVASTVDYKLRNVEEKIGAYELLIKPLREGTVDPVVYEDLPATGRRLVNGHHRVAMAVRLGIEKLPVINVSKVAGDRWWDGPNGGSDWWFKCREAEKTQEARDRAVEKAEMLGQL